MAPLIAKLETIITTPSKPKEAHRSPSATVIKAKIYTPGNRGHPPNNARPLHKTHSDSGSGRTKKFHMKPAREPLRHNKIQDKCTTPPSPPSEASLVDLSWPPTALYQSPDTQIT